MTHSSIVGVSFMTFALYLNIYCLFIVPFASVLDTLFNPSVAYCGAPFQVHFLCAFVAGAWAAFGACAMIQIPAFSSLNNLIYPHETILALTKGEKILMKWKFTWTAASAQRAAFYCTAQECNLPFDVIKRCHEEIWNALSPSDGSAAARARQLHRSIWSDVSRSCRFTLQPSFLCVLG